MVVIMTEYNGRLIEKKIIISKRKNIHMDMVHIFLSPTYQLWHTEMEISINMSIITALLLLNFKEKLLDLPLRTVLELSGRIGVVFFYVISFMITGLNCFNIFKNSIKM